MHKNSFIKIYSIQRVFEVELTINQKHKYVLLLDHHFAGNLILVFVFCEKTERYEK